MYLSMVEAARELGISSRQLRRQAASGRVATSRYGNTRVIASRQILMMSRTDRRGRDWTEKTRAAALDLLAGGTTDEVVGTERSRIKQRVRNASAQTLASQILTDHVSLRRATNGETKSRFTPSILRELGLSTGGGLGVLISENAMRDARRARLGQNDSGDIVVLSGHERHRRILEALALYAYGDARESAAAAAWISTAQTAI